jgi:hypothetical protein
MASELDRDRSRFVEPLPACPNLEMQQKRAKECCALRGMLTRQRSNA